MSDIDEELSMEDKKKAVSLQDLVYIKKYIDKNQEEYESGMDKKQEEYESAMDKKQTAYEKKITQQQTDYKSTMDKKQVEYETAMDEKYTNFTKTVKKDIANGTMEVGCATNANNAIKNADGSYSAFIRDDDGILKTSDGFTIPQRKLIFEGETQSVDISSFNLKAGCSLEIETNFDSNAIYKVKPKTATQMLRMVTGNNLTYYGCMITCISGLYYSLTSVSYPSGVTVLNGLKSASENAIGTTPTYYLSQEENDYKITRIWVVYE